MSAIHDWAIGKSNNVPRLFQNGFDVSKTPYLIDQAGTQNGRNLSGAAV